VAAAAPTSQAGAVTPAVQTTPGSSSLEGTFIITGQVQHSTGNSLPGGLKVTLQGFEGQMQEVFNAETEAAPDGKFAFKDLQRAAGRMYVVTVDYNGVKFFSDVVPSGDLKAGETVDLPVKVYETTQDASALIVERAHVFLNFEQPGKVQVVEMFNIVNPHPQVVVAPPGQPLLRFKLPPAATNLAFQDGALGQRYVQTADGFGDTGSILPAPAPYQLLFSFEIPYPENQAGFAFTSPLPVQSLLVAAPVADVQVKNDRLTDGGQRSLQGSQIQLYQASDLAAGEPLNLVISGWPGGTNTGSGNFGSLLFGIGAFALAVTVAGIFFFRQQRNARLPVEEEEPEEEQESADTLLDAILALEDRFQAGELAEDVFRQRRAVLKEQLNRALVLENEQSTQEGDNG